MDQSSTFGEPTQLGTPPMLAHFKERLIHIMPTKRSEHHGFHILVGTLGVALALTAFVTLDLLAGRWGEAAQSAVLAGLFLIIGTRLLQRNSPESLGRLALVIILETLSGANRGYTFFWFYPLPLGSFFVLGRREGLVWFSGITLILIWLLFGPAPQPTDGSAGPIIVTTFITIGLLCHGLETARFRLSRRLMREKTALEKAVQDLEALYGLLPICASCKSVRDDEGYWHSIENYLSDHSEVELEAAACPNCRLGTDAYPALQTISASPSKNPPKQQAVSQKEEHRHRRRIYFTVGMAVLIPFMAYFALLDIHEGRTMDGGITLAMLGIFLVSVVWLHLGTSHRAAYELTLGGALPVIIYGLYVGLHGGYAMLWVYAFPMFAIFVLGTRGLFWSLAALAIATASMLAPFGFAYPIAMSGRFLTTLALVTLLTYGLEWVRDRSERQLAQESESLRQTLQEVTTLRGLLPICPSCKSVRDDQGFWNQIEDHMIRITGTRFSHGLCPDCTQQALAQVDEL